MRWLVIGHYGGHNTGDESMLTGLICGINRMTDHELVIATKTGTIEYLPPYSRVKVIRNRLSTIVCTIFNTTGVIVGGGTHFHDDYRNTRLFRHYGYMLRIILISLIARLMYKQVFWLGMGFGPFRYSTTVLLTNLGIHLCHGVAVRDLNSFMEVAHGRNITKVQVTFDLAALMLLEKCASRTHSSKVNKEEKIIGLSVLSLKNISSIEDDQRLFENLCPALKSILNDDKLLKLRIFVIRGGNRESDIAISKTYYDELSTMFPGRIELMNYQENPIEMFHQICECHAFIATRFHAGLLGYLANCRLIFLVYQRKVQDLAYDIGLHSYACIQIRENIHENSMRQKIQEMLQGDLRFKANLQLAKAMKLSVRNLAFLKK